MGHFQVTKLKAITYQTFTFATYYPPLPPITNPPPLPPTYLPSFTPFPPPSSPPDAINVTKATFAFNCFLRKFEM